VLAALDGDKSKLVIDLSCRRRGGDSDGKWFVAMNKWQTITDMEVNQGTFDHIILLTHAEGRSCVVCLPGELVS
jgi:hypothetical protein